ncbi:SusC/RagA family TonB-linked outer membrane protein [Bacteroides sp.]
MKQTIFLILCLFCSVGAMAQAKSIIGVVKDGTGETVIGASVVEAGTTNGTITDFDGKFSLNVAKGAKITISYIGYKPQTITVGNENNYNIVLQEDSEVLDEVVVTGYGGSQKRATLTTAISKLDNSVLKNAAFSNAGQSLQGSVTGLRVVNTSGQPGSEPNITLRGGATITGDNSKALIVVDGIVRNSMSDINPSDIESIQVLKDAASTAIYGARANGGVILVETKSGKEGKASVNYKFKVGVNFARKGYEFSNAQDYIYYNRMGYKRYFDSTTGAKDVDTQSGYGIGDPLYDIRYLTDATAHLQNEGWKTMDDPYYAGKKILFKDYSGQMDDAVFNNSALTQDHYLSITGGNDKGTYSSSLGYYNEDGQIKGTGYKRFNGSLNGSYKVFPFLTVRGGTTYSWSTQPELWIGTYEMFYRTRSQRPTWSPWLPDGSPAAGVGKDDGNPEYYRDKLTSENSTRKSTYNMGFTLDILPKKLVLNGNASLYHYDYQREKFNKSYQTQTSPTPDNTRQAEAKTQKYTQIQLNGTLTYTDTFAEKHNLEAMAGTEYFTYDQFDFEAKTQNSPTDDIPTLNAGSNRTYTSTTKTAYRILSGFGRINYNYDMKYLLSFVARYDGISKLKDNRWGFFPGVSVGWNVMEETFWKNSKLSDIVSNLKPRVSYGVNGNVNGIGNYEVYGSYSQVSAGGTNYNYGGQTAIWNSGLVNTGLRWEQSQSFEAGLDIGFLNNRLSFILDYYNRSTKDLLTKQALPGYTGFNEIMTNMGTLRNYGFEMEVRANLLNNPKGLTWDVTANLSSVANKIVKLPNNGNVNNRVGGYEVAAGPMRADGTFPTKWIAGRQEGGKLGELVAYKQNHIFKDWDDVKKYANNRVDEVANLYGPGVADKYAGKEGWKPIEPGDVCWEDINGDGVINGYDRMVVGNIFPNITGGFSTTLGYKGVSLYARFDYALGHTIYNDLAARSLGQYQGSFNVITDVKNMWSETNTNTDLPAFYYADQLSKKNITRSNNGTTAVDNNSSRFYEKGDYLALRELTLNYNLPKTWISKVGMTDASVYVTGQNLFYITGYTGTSPEPAVDSTYGRGIDNGRYPTPRTVLFGLSVTF